MLVHLNWASRRRKKCSWKIIFHFRDVRFFDVRTLDLITKIYKFEFFFLKIQKRLKVWKRSGQSLLVPRQRPLESELYLTSPLWRSESQEDSQQGDTVILGAVLNFSWSEFISRSTLFDSNLIDTSLYRNCSWWCATIHYNLLELS